VSVAFTFSLFILILHRSTLIHCISHIHYTALPYAAFLTYTTLHSHTLHFSHSLHCTPIRCTTHSFGLEGGESLIPSMKSIIDRSAELGECMCVCVSVCVCECGCEREAMYCVCVCVCVCVCYLFYRVIYICGKHTSSIYTLHTTHYTIL
jgi:hypothetical protein